MNMFQKTVLTILAFCLCSKAQLHHNYGMRQLADFDMFFDYNFPLESEINQDKPDEFTQNYLSQGVMEAVENSWVFLVGVFSTLADNNFSDDYPIFKQVPLLILIALILPVLLIVAITYFLCLYVGAFEHKESKASKKWQVKKIEKKDQQNQHEQWSEPFPWI